MYLNELEVVASISSRKAKMARLKVWGAAMQEIARLAYDPYIRFHTTLRGLTHTGQEELNLTVLEQLSPKELEAYAAQLNPRAQEVLRRIVRKDLRIGLGAKSILQAFPGLFELHSVMLAQDIDWSRLKYPCWATAKLDGLRAIWHRGKFYTRNGIAIKGLSHLAAVLPREHKIDGELIVPTESFYTASGLIRNHKEVPEVEFYIIDVPSCSASFLKDRLKSLAFDSVPPKVKFTPGVRVGSKAKAQKAYDYYRKLGYEGVVFKPLEYKYVGSRSYSWMKLKPIKTADVKVVDFFEGTGRNKGRLGGLVVDFNGAHVKVGSGFSDKLREEFWDNPPIGKIIEVQYQEVTPAGSLRHPRFIKLREDK